MWIKKLLYFALSVYIVSALGFCDQGEELYQQYKSSDKTLRIASLFPRYMVARLAVEPAIPENFVLVEDPKSDRFFWGVKEEIQPALPNYGASALKTAAFRLYLSDSCAQTGPDSLSTTSSELEKMAKSLGVRNVSITTTKWGNYPVLSVKGKVSDKKLFRLAYIGLNCPDGWVMVASLVHPDREGHPNKQDEQLWDDFIKNTKALSEPDFFIVHGQDLQPGYTILEHVGFKMTVVAEKRKNDNQLQIVLLPHPPGVSYTFDHLEEVLMGAQWNYGAPLVKLFGTLNLSHNEGWSVHTDEVISVLVKDVDEFSLKKKDVEKKPENIFLSQQSTQEY